MLRAMLRTMLALLLVGCGGAASTAPPQPPPPATPDPSAKRAPDFTLESTEGQPVTLSKLLQNGPVILAFFPKAFTGG